MSATSVLRYNGLLCGSAAPTLGSAMDNSQTTLPLAAALKLNDGATNVPTIADPRYLVGTIDAGTSTEEIVWITALTAGNATPTVARGQEGTTAVAHSSGAKVVFGPTALDFLTGTLATATGSNNNTDYTTASSTSADVDAANLVATFTIPRSGAVLIDVIFGSYNSGGNSTYLELRESTTVLQDRIVQQGNANNWNSSAVRFLVTALTPGASKTYKLGFRTNSGTSHIGNGDGTTGQAAPTVMSVTAAA